MCSSVWWSEEQHVNIKIASAYNCSTSGGCMAKYGDLELNKLI
jgi:hypothetical protein